jgi:arabinofuranosyltransferase
MERRPARRIAVASLGVAALGLAASVAYLPCVLDDAFIAFRYAENLARHGELTFNPGRAPVEGFSSPLWMLSLSAVAWLFDKASLAPAAAGLGLLCFASSLLLAGSIAQRLTAREAATSQIGSLFSIALLALCPSACFYASTGLEPMLFVLVTLCVAGSALGVAPRSLGGACAALASWVRPEGPFLLVPLALIALRHRERRRDVLSLSLCLGLGSVALLALRLSVFSDWLPNTFYAKAPQPWAGLRYLAELLITPWLLGPLVLGNLGALWGGRSFRTFAWIGWSWLLAAVLEGGDWMPLGRFALPAIASFAVAAAGCATLTPVRARLGYALLSAASVLSLFATSARVETQQRQRRTLYHEGRVMAAWLKRAQVRSLALMDIGEIGFMLDSEIVDLAGLTDEKIGHGPGAHLEKRIDTHYVLAERRPEAIVLRTKRPPFRSDGNVDPEAASSQPEFDLLVAPQLRADYQLLFSLVPETSRASFYGALVFLRKGTIIPEAARLPGLVVSVTPIAD